VSLSQPQRCRNQVAVLARRRPNSPELEQARRELAAAKIEDYIKRTVEGAPPLTDEQRTRIASLLRPTPTSGGRNDAA
jgi:hypothetical protein